jgi:hypothetical protein
MTMADPQVFLAKMQDASRTMKAVASRLDYLADGIEFVGLPKIVEPLRDSAKVLRLEAVQLDNAIGDMIEHLITESDQATFNMVRTALAVATMPACKSAVPSPNEDDPDFGGRE